MADDTRPVGAEVAIPARTVASDLWKTLGVLELRALAPAPISTAGTTPDLAATTRRRDAGRRLPQLEDGTVDPDRVLHVDQAAIDDAWAVAVRDTAELLQLNVQALAEIAIPLDVARRLWRTHHRPVLWPGYASEVA